MNASLDGCGPAGHGVSLDPSAEEDEVSEAQSADYGQPDDVLVAALAEAIYETMFDPRCDVEGAVWDDAVSIATKVATRFERAGWWMEWDGSAYDATTNEWLPARRKELRRSGRLPGRNGTKAPVYRLVQPVLSGSSAAADEPG